MINISYQVAAIYLTAFYDPAIQAGSIQQWHEYLLVQQSL